MDLKQKLVRKRKKAYKDGSRLDKRTASFEMAEYYFSREEWKAALTYFKEAEEISLGTGENVDVAVLNRWIGECYCNLKDYVQAIKHQQKHLELACKANIKVEEQRALATLGRTYYVQAQELSDTEGQTKSLALAEKYYRKSLAVCDEVCGISQLELMQMRARLYLNLGLVKELCNQMREGIDFVRKALDLCTRYQLSEELYMAYVNLIPMYHDLKNDSKALEMCELALAQGKLIKNKNSLPILTQKADILLALPDLRGARQTLQKAYKLSSQPDIEKKLRLVASLYQWEQDIMSTQPEDYATFKQLYENMGDGYVASQHYGEALKYYLKMLECAELLGESGEALVPCYVSLYQTYKDDKQYDKALDYSKLELQCHKGNPQEACKTKMNIAVLKELLSYPTEEVRMDYLEAQDLAAKANNAKLQNKAMKYEKKFLSERNPTLSGCNADTDECKMKKEGNISSSDEELELEELSDEAQDEEIGAHINLLALTDESESESDNEITSAPRESRRSSTKFSTRRNNKGETPLHTAAIDGNLKLVQQLLRQGHKVNVTDYGGWMPLHEACNHGHSAVVKCLLEAGAAINARGGTAVDGITPLLDAAANGNLEIVELLLDHGANPLLRTHQGMSAVDSLVDWRSRHKSEMRWDIDGSTLCHFNNICRRLTTAIEKAGQQALQVIPPDDSQSNKVIHEQKNVLGGTKKRSCISGPDMAVLDYEKTMKSLRRDENTRISMVGQPRGQSLNSLIDPHMVIDDDWLVNDLQSEEQKSKKRKTMDPAKKTLTNRPRTVSNVRLSRDCNKRDIAVESDVSSSSSDFTVPDLDNSEWTASAITDNFSAVIDIRSTLNSTDDDVRVARKKNRTQFQTDQVQSTSPKTLAKNAPVASFKVQVEGILLLVPIATNCSVLTLTVDWLAKEAAKRYYSMEGTLPELRLTTEDGAVLYGQDPLSMLQGVQIIKSVVRGWDRQPIKQCYKHFCDTTNPNSFSNRIAQLLTEASESGKFVLTECCLTHKEIEPVTLALKNMTMLQFLQISDCDLGNQEGPMFVADSLAKMPQLKVLKLTTCNMTSAGLTQMAQSVARHRSCQTLESVDFSYNNLGSNSVEALNSIIANLPALTSLKLIGIGLTDEAFGNKALSLESIEELDISLNQVSMREIVKCLDVERVRKLTTKSIRSKTAGGAIQEMAIFLASGRPHNLVELNMDTVYTCNREMVELTRALRDAPQLNSLTIYGIPQLSADILRQLKDMSLHELKITVKKSTNKSTRQKPFQQFVNSM